MNTKIKNIVKITSLAMAGVAACTAIGFGVKAIVDYTKEDLKTITPSFEVGSLGEDGKYIADESVLYTKEAFGCYGLQIKPDFDSTVNYQIFYYDILDNYISSTEVLSDGYSGEAPVNGAYARLVIKPRNDEDGKISLTERISYPKQLTIKVNKEQDLNKRFVIFQGKVLEVVNNTNELVFTNRLFLDSNDLFWSVDNRGSVTSNTVLKVTDCSSINFSSSQIEKSITQFEWFVYQFSGLPAADTYLGRTNCHKESSFIFDKATKYIIILLYTNEPSLSWNDELVLLFPSCFTLNKTK